MTLLDTHVLLWHELGNRKLGPQARRTFERALQAGDAAVSAISFWEVGMQVQKGRLDFRLDLDAWRRTLLQEGLVQIPVDGEIGIRANELAAFHGDPADRLVVATALVGGHQMVTADRRILEWPGPLRRLDATQ